MPGSDKKDLKMTGLTRISTDILRQCIASDTKVNILDIEVSGYELTKGSAAGEGFACDTSAVIVQSRVRGEKRTFNYFIKMTPTDSMRLEHFGKVIL